MERLKVEEYKEAVNKLLQLAQGDSGGSRIAGQVLLSCYNGQAFQADLAGMRNLDRGNFETAMTVIRGSFDCGREPHELVTDGSAVFRRLWDQWRRLHVEERGKPECRTCDGRGRVYINQDDDNDMSMKTCTTCNGSGKVCHCQG